MSTRLHISVMAACLFSVGAISGMARASQPSRVDDATPSVNMAESIRLLASDSLVERAAASIALTDSDRVPLRDIEAALRGDNLSPEQRLRLERVAYTKFASSPRGALGIRFQQRVADGPNSGTVVDATYEGFDAHRVLRSGDVIHSIDGERVLTIDDGKRTIQSHDPGERLTLRIFRDGEPLLARVTLGSLRALDQMAPGGRGGLGRGNEYILRDAFDDRLARSCGRGTRWPGVLDLRSFEPAGEGVLPAAQALAATPQLDPDKAAPEPPGVVTAGGVQRPVTTEVASNIDFSGSAGRTANLRAIQDQLRTVQSRMMQEQRLLADLNRPAAERQAAARRLEALRQQQIQLNIRYGEVKAKLVNP